MNPRPDLTTLHHFSITVPDVRDAVFTLGVGLDFETVELHDDWAFLRFANVFMAVLKAGGKHPPHIAEVVNETVWRVCSRIKKPHKHRDKSESVYFDGVSGGPAIELVRENSLTPALKLL